MNAFAPIRILWPYGPLRIIFTVVAVLSAVGLYVAYPRFASSLPLFVTATILIFAVEVTLFEFGIRRYAQWVRSIVPVVQRNETVEIGDQFAPLLRLNEEWQRLSRELISQINDQGARNSLVFKQIDESLRTLAERVNSLCQVQQTYEDSDKKLQDQIAAVRTELNELNASIRELEKHREKMQMSQRVVPDPISASRGELKILEEELQRQANYFRTVPMGDVVFLHYKRRKLVEVACQLGTTPQVIQKLLAPKLSELVQFNKAPSTIFGQTQQESLSSQEESGVKPSSSRKS